MNEKEKQAIEFLKHSLYEYEEIDTSVLEYIDKNHKIIYKLILKQQKEIEKLKSRKYIFNAETNEIKEIPISDDYISKDKIKGKIEELKNRKIGASTGIFAVQVDILEELLGEY